jgi:hypothetical protein
MGYLGGNGVLYGYTLGIPWPVRTCGIHGSAHGGALRPRVRAGVRAIGRARARWGAGVTWTCRTAKAEWAARNGQTSVIDARTRAIYVIGGEGTTDYQDVWASTDGGARAGLGQGGWSGGTQLGTLGGTQGY